MTKNLKHGGGTGRGDSGRGTWLNFNCKITVEFWVCLVSMWCLDCCRKEEGSVVRVFWGGGQLFMC